VTRLPRKTKTTRKRTRRVETLLRETRTLRLEALAQRIESCAIVADDVGGIPYTSRRLRRLRIDVLAIAIAGGVQ